MVSAPFATELREGEDPRLSSEYVRVVDTGEGYPVVVVGVVHDHPASVFRVRSVVDSVAPPTLALELPAALVPLFEDYAESGDPGGGEMAAAIDAAPAANPVGIDAPNVGSARVLLSELHRDRASPRSVARTLREFGRLTVETARGRLSAAGVPDAWLGDVPGTTQEFDCSPADSPGEQAAHESSHVRRSTSLLRSFDVPTATRLLDGARERYMVRRLAALSEESVVVAVVGFSHLDAVASGLAAE